MRDLDFEDADGDGLSDDGTAWSEGGSQRDGWLPIGLQDPYSAIFDGNGYVIRNLYIHRLYTDDVGLFGRVEDGWLCNVGLEDVSIVGRRRVGSLAGTASAPVERSFATGTVRGVASVGGLVGVLSGNSTTHLVSCYATATVSGTSAQVGGLVGQAVFGPLIGSYATGSVTGGSQVGGLVGSLQADSSIVSSYASGAVVATAGTAGGLTGLHYGSITASYSVSSVTGHDALDPLVGGLSGFGPALSDSYYSVSSSVVNRGAGGVNALGAGRTFAELIAPTAPGPSPGTLYHQWNRDVTGTLTAVPAAVLWDFSSPSFPPLLRADLDGDGISTALEFGAQLRSVVSFVSAASTAFDGHIPSGASRVVFESIPSVVSLSVSSGGFSSSTEIPLTLSLARGSLNAADYTFSLAADSPVTLSGTAGSFLLTIPSGVSRLSLSFSSRDADLEGEEVLLSLGGPFSYGRVEHRIFIEDLADETKGEYIGNPSLAGFLEVTPVAPGGPPVFSGYLHVSPSVDIDSFFFRLPASGFLTVFAISSDGRSSGLFKDREANIIASDDTSGVADSFRITHRFDLPARTADSDWPPIFFISLEPISSGDASAVTPAHYDLHVEFSPFLDYDTDGDGLIEISTLSQLDAVRYDLDGDGLVSSGVRSHYGAAFPLALGSSEHRAPVCAGGCRGYELVSDLDFEGCGRRRHF